MTFIITNEAGTIEYDDTVVEENLIEPVNVNDGPTSGNPSNVPPLALGQVENTSVGVSNDNLSHICDITGNLRYSIIYASFQVNEAVEAVRTTIEGLFTAASASPFGDAIRTSIKYVQAKLKLLQKYLKKAQQAIAAVKQFIAEVESLIKYIATLPAKLVNLLAQCLVNAKNSLLSAINLGGSISAVSNTISPLIVTAQTAVSSKNSTVSSINSNVGKP